MLMDESKEEQVSWVRYYLASAVLYGSALGIYFTLPYYGRLLNDFAREALITFYVGYLGLSPFYYLRNKKSLSANHSYRILSYAYGMFQALRAGEFRRFTQKEKVSALFLGVKFFFLPIMLKFVGNHLSYFDRVWENPDKYLFYHIFISALFFVDTAIFSVGYLFEFEKWNNKIRSVEPTFLGWFVALACYPPFNGFWGVPWGANDDRAYWDDTSTIIMRCITGALLVIYTWASVALGPKASNLTNRGIVTRFPYSFIRHPAYISKVAMWWITMLPVMSVPFALGMTFWTVIYFLRALTEERHLGMDPEYRAYCEKVRWRFIRGIY